MNAKNKYIYNAIGFSILIFLIIRNYLPGILNIMNLDENINLVLIFSSLSLILACILPIISLEKLINFTPKIFKKANFEKIAPYVFFSQILFLVITVLNQLIINVIEYILKIEFPAQSLLEIDSLQSFILYFISIAIIPSVFEELFIRGYILNLLSNYGKFSALIISSLIFSLMHQNIEQLFPAFLSSLILGCIYLKTNNVLTCILAHLLNNSYSFIMIYINQYVHGVSAPFILIFINFSLLIFGFYGYFTLKNQRELPLIKDFKNKNSDRNSYKLFLFSPVLIISLACCIGTIYITFMENFK